MGLTILTFLTTVLFVAPAAFAQTNTGNGRPNFFQGLIQFIEQKFGLNQTQVQSAVNEYKAQVKATITPRPTQTPQQIQAREKARLDKLVAAGKISGDQETSILNELSTLSTQYNLSGLTGTQRETEMQAMQTAFKAWATNNNINIAYVMPFGGMYGRGGFRGHWGPTPTP